MPYDAWEHFCYTTSWVMNNIPPLEDHNHFAILSEREREYQADLDFYGDYDYIVDYDTNDPYYNCNDDYIYDSEDNYSSSDSEYEEFEYI